MPSTKKMLHFMSSALVTALSVGLLGFGMSINWAEMNMKCDRGADGFFNGSAEITMGLFRGRMVQDSCPGFGAPVDFEVIPKLTDVGAAPVALHVLTVCLLAVSLVCSACSILISLYNSVSNPYETYMGPIGLYVCSSLSACLSVVVLILFAVNINVTSMAEDLVKSFAGGFPVDFKDRFSVVLVGYYMGIPYMLLSLGAIGLIYMYDHAAYTQRREQQRPTEDAPKEIMMY